MKYKQITISTTHEFSDIVSVLLCDYSSEGVSVYDAQEFRETLDAFSWDYADDSFFSDVSGVVLVSGYFDEDFDESVVAEGLNELRGNAQAGSLEMSCAIIDSAEWENVWMQFYKPMQIGSIAIVPKWLKNPFENALPVYINPGMAFGTGSHETTSMCVELMQDGDLTGVEVADIGCGSGILGLCTLRLGAKTCTLVDIDPNAVKAARDNAEYNGLLNKCDIIEGSLFGGKAESFDLVLANLTADILLQLYPLLSSALKVGGTAIISGIIDKRLNEVTEVFLKGFRLVRLLSRGDWHALRLEKTI